MNAHYDEEALIALLDSGADADPHLAACSECRESLDEYRHLTASLADTAPWEPPLPPTPPNPQTIANLRAFAEAQRTEDEAAIPLVATLLAGPREEWMPRLLADPQYRTAGVVRKLMEASDKAIDVMPPDALEISALATEIADNLKPEKYPSDTVMKLRGNAWRDRSFCLFYSGNLHKASHSVGISLSAFEDCTVAEHDIARLRIVLALNQRALDNFDEALEEAQSGSQVFERFGDTERLVASSIAETHSLLKIGKAHDALNRLLRILPYASEICDDAKARLFSNLGFCYREIGDVVSAVSYFEVASAIFATHATGEIEALRLRWNVGTLLGAAGFEAEAERRFVALVAEFERRGMLSESILVRLELAESFLHSGRYQELESTCREALAYFNRQGLADTVRARTALAYLLEASREKRLTVTGIQHVRSFLRRLPAEPNLLFAPAP